MVHRIRLTNRVAYFGVDSDPASLQPYFRFRVPNYWFAPKYRLGLWDGYIQLFKRSQVAAGLLQYRLTDLRQDGLKLRIDDRRVAPKFRDGWPTLTTGEVRQFQRDCVDNMIAAARTGGLVLNATGTGKTFIAGLLFWRLQGTGVFVVDELTLLEQARTELASILGESIGMIGDSVFQPDRITVATVQTLHLHRDDRKFRRWSEGLDCMVVDEVHLALNHRTQDTIRNMKPKSVFGLTATLELKKENVLLNAVALAGPVLFEFPYQEGLEAKVLCPGVVVGVDLLRCHPPARGMPWRDLYRIDVVKSPKRNQYICDLIREGYRRGKSIIALVERVEHLKLLSRQLRDIPHQMIYGAKKTKDRVAAKKLMETGDLRVILANKVFMKGVNIKKADVILDAAGLSSRNGSIQKFGRGARLAAGKTGLIYLDIGERKPKGAVGMNRFSAATKRRRKALKSLGVPVNVCLANRGAAYVFDVAETMLKEVAAQLGKS